jgi:excisionase family DNA binding protein
MGGKTAEKPRPRRSFPGARPPLERANETVEKLWSVEALADYIGVTAATIHNWTHNRKIRVVKIGNRTRIKNSEVERIIAEGEIPRRGEE